MLKPEQIPMNVLVVFYTVWEMTRSTKKFIAAALNAWEGAHHYKPNAEPYYGKHLILPLPVEKSNDSA